MIRSAESSGRPHRSRFWICRYPWRVPQRANNQADRPWAAPRMGLEIHAGTRCAVLDPVDALAGRDDDYMCMTFLRDKEVTARKLTRCAWCNEEIYAGERARARTFRDSDGLRSDHLHPECYDAVVEFGAEEGMCAEFYPGDHERGSTDPV